MTSLGNIITFESTPVKISFCILKIYTNYKLPGFRQHFSKDFEITDQFSTTF